MACSVCDSEHIAQSSVCSYTLLQPTWAFGCCRVDLDFFPCGRSFCCYPPGMPWIQQLTDGSAIFMGPWPCHPLEAFELLYLTFSWGSVISQVSSVPLLVRPLQRHVCSAVFLPSWLFTLSTPNPFSEVSLHGTAWRPVHSAGA